MTSGNTAQPRGVFLPFDFQFGDVDNGPLPPSDNPPLDVLENFSGHFVGTGFNTIFRPNGQGTPILELNFTKEGLSFSRPLGSVPNRGQGSQSDISLNGVGYLQTVLDMTNTATGKADNPQPVGIHSETGFWMNVPACTTNPGVGPTLVRMGSIPHGTTINAQGAPAVKTQGPPNISSQSIIPFSTIGHNNVSTFTSLVATKPDDNRIPKDLGPFIAQGTISPEMLADPTVFLTNINKQLIIADTSTFTVTTQSTVAQPGGGCANIAFLVGQPGNAGPGPNANVVEVDATFYVETVEAELHIPAFNPATDKGPILLQPVLAVSTATPPPLPTFTVTLPKQTMRAEKVFVPYTQIQYVQTVMLNFEGLTWPHVSVGTLVPANPIETQFQGRA